jgi:hypothetical protein
MNRSRAPGEPGVQDRYAPSGYGLTAAIRLHVTESEEYRVTERLPLHRLWRQWLAATGLGWLVYAQLQTSVLALVGVLLIGIGQWSILRRHMDKVQLWPLVTPISLILGGIVGGIFGGRLQDLLDGVYSPRFGIRSPFESGRTQVASLLALAFAGACMGAAMGAVQWRLLRRQASGQTLWLLAHTAGLALGTILMSITPNTVYANLASSVLVGITSAYALGRCLHRSQVNGSLEEL